MSYNLPNTILRSGSYVFTCRVPKAIQPDFGAELIRVPLGRDKEHAKLLAEGLTRKLDEIWSSPMVRPVNVMHLLNSIAPKVTTLDEAVDRYLEHKGIGRGQGFEKVVRIAVRALVQAAGNKDIKRYDREDARAFLRLLTDGGAKTGTVRRRLNTIKAIFEHAYIEGEIERRNPFARLSIPGERADAEKRGTFTQEQLGEAYSAALAGASEIKLIVPILGETGARLAEIIGLRLSDVHLDPGAISIVPHAGRRLKTRGSEREVPLVGAAFEAMKLLIAKRRASDEYLFPRYVKGGIVMATHASNAVNKWLRRDFGGLTCHGLRRTLRDGLRTVEAPIDLIDQIGGWSSAGGIGVAYGRGYSLEHKAAYERDMSYTAAFLAATIKGAQRAYDTLSEFVPPEDLYLHTSTHAEGDPEQAAKQHGEEVAEHIRKFGPFQRGQLNRSRIVIATHELWMREGATGLDLGLRLFGASTSRMNVFIDEVPFVWASLAECILHNSR